ncbi:TCDD-inducible poly [ADP-ribose] polymerase [Chelonia mydas]|uniref:TCDD-inducible poly [ADP-ribose] polymerase n=1 Tax=Chelonia mydas TaxID=8469 RepID=M7BHS4_CHEMY|nr:TCDD-inducible poly [ADP-ribose] polymerase [Chelonia mydas]
MQHGDDSKSHLVAPEQLEDENGIQFHIHHANGIRICDRFLLGLCKEGERCQLHHTCYPYHWQVMRKKKGVWQSVNESAQQHLEKLYSNVNDSLVTLVENSTPGPTPPTGAHPLLHPNPLPQPVAPFCTPNPSAPAWSPILHPKLLIPDPTPEPAPPVRACTPSHTPAPCPSPEKLLSAHRDGSKGKVNLNAMDLFSFGPYGKIRRLSNTHDPQQNPHLHTEWHMYWLDETNWKEYEEPISQEIINAFESGLQSYSFSHEGQQYSLDLKNLIQTNSTTEQKSSIQRRPAYRTPTDMVPHLRTLPNGCRGHLNPYAANIPGEDPTDVYSGPYPASWISCPSEGPTYVQCEIAPSEAVYRTVYTLFHKSLSEDTFLVLGIYRIRQEYLWQKYSSQKEIMSRGLSTEEKKQLERHLFHGTSADSKNSICQMGFDPRLSGQNLAAFGKGSYFAKNAQYSNGFCTACKAGLRYMFLAKVLVGKSAVGNANYCQPPRIRSSGRPFDSCVDSASSIYVIFNSSQSYPYFLICYKLLSDPVALDGS